jgi:hypothetical protein
MLPIGLVVASYEVSFCFHCSCYPFCMVDAKYDILSLRIRRGSSEMATRC